MKKFKMFAAVLGSALFVLGTFAGEANAKCYTFADTEIRVCVKGDSFSDRDKAKDICKAAKGSSCGDIKSSSSSCSSGKCYDENGDKQSSLKDY